MFVEPAQVRGWWPKIKYGVERAIANQDCDTIAEDVYLSLRTGGAQLFIADRGGNYQGFVVCTKQERLEGAALYVWIAYSPYEGVGERFYPRVAEIAKEAGIKRVAFGSNRPGWERLAKRYGFKKRMTVYEQEVA